MALDMSLLFGEVMHARLFPKRNHFLYRIFYMAMPLSRLKSLPIAHNRFGLFSFYDKDHGQRDGSSLVAWASDILNQYGVNQADGEIVLVCMPRVLGYVFNPVSFWLCLDKQGRLRAVLNEVNNTFGERHTYLCVHADQRPIEATDSLVAKKVFHVSPMLKREGHYTFRFDYSEQAFTAAIDYFDGNNNKQLVTRLTGNTKPMSKRNLRRAFLLYPLVTMKAMALIHWQALKLLSGGISFNKKPEQLTRRVTGTTSIRKTEI
jgi:DUF1365 family protein